MKYEDFKKELERQIVKNSKYFKGKDWDVLVDFKETIQKEDFEE